MGNGMPISAVVGKKEYMQEFEKVFFSGTFYGETLSLAAALATIREVREQGVIEHIWKQGKKLKDGFNSMARDLGVKADCLGYPPRTKFFFYDKDGKESLKIKSLFMQETVKRGVLFGAAQLVTYSHSDDDINRTLEAVYEALKVVRDACGTDDIDRFMEGEYVGIVFRPV
jgi:glutamate-1-semialdehyde aminotransferase